MDYEEIVAVLGYASSHDLMVHITLLDGTILTGLPTSVDTHVTANEVYLRVGGLQEEEISLSLAQVAQVQLA